MAIRDRMKAENRRCGDAFLIVPLPMKSTLRGSLTATALAGLVAGQLSSRAATESPPPDPYQARFEKMSGRELTRRLTAKDTRARAFYELMRRAIAAEPDRRYLGKDEGFAIFVRNYAAPELTLCPQRNQAPPLYLVAHNRSYRTTSPVNLWGEEPFAAPRPFELFPPREYYHQPPPDPDLRAFQFFNAEGARVDVLAADDFSPANLADLTGDGVLEYVSVARKGLEASDPGHIAVVQVQTVEEEGRWLLNLLINWGATDWSYRLADTDGDGRKEIEIGPVSGHSIRPRAVFRWDKKAGAFRGPKPADRDHFRVLKNGWDVFPELTQWAASGLTVPKEPVAAKSEAQKGSSRQETSDDGKLWPFPQRLPADFWKRGAKEAVLAFADANRSVDHRNEFRIALEDRDGATPPQAGTLALTNYEQGCLGATGREWFLSFQPGDSYLITAKADAAVSIGKAERVQLRWQPLPEADARRIAAVVWWLDRLRTFPVERPEICASTLTRDRWLRLRDGGGTMLLQDQVTSMNRTWEGAFTRQLHLDATAWLLSATLPRTDPPDDLLPALEASAAAARILAAWSPDEARVSHALAAAAAKEADRGDAAIVARLREIAGQIPRDEHPPGREEEVIGREIDELSDAIVEADMRQWETEDSTPKSGKPKWSSEEFAAHLAKRQALLAEQTEARIRRLDTGADLLRAAIESVLDGK